MAADQMLQNPGGFSATAGQSGGVSGVSAVPNWWQSPGSTSNPLAGGMSNSFAPDLAIPNQLGQAAQNNQNWWSSPASSSSVAAAPSPAIPAPSAPATPVIQPDAGNGVLPVSGGIQPIGGTTLALPSWTNTLVAPNPNSAIGTSLANLPSQSQDPTLSNFSPVDNNVAQAILGLNPTRTAPSVNALPTARTA